MHTSEWLKPDLFGADAPDFAASLAEIRDAIAEEANPALMALEAQAAALANMLGFKPRTY